MQAKTPTLSVVRSSRIRPPSATRISRLWTASATHTAPSVSRQIPSGTTAACARISAMSVEAGGSPKAAQFLRSLNEPGVTLKALRRFIVDSATVYGSTQDCVLSENRRPFVADSLPPQIRRQIAFRLVTAAALRLGEQ